MRRFAFGLALTLTSIALPAAAQEEPAPPPDAPKEEPPPATPSIVIEAKDDTGRDVKSVTILVDDKVVAYELPDAPIELAPGAHTITVQRNDGPRQRATASVTLTVGETSRPVRVTFERPPAPEPALAPAPEAPLAPRIVAGVGIAGVITGVVLLLARPSLATNCSSDTYRCTRLPEETDARFAEERKDAVTNRDLGTAGLVTLLSGAGVTAAGVLWYVIDRPETAKPRSAMGIAPWLQGQSGGLILRSSF